MISVSCSTGGLESDSLLWLVSGRTSNAALDKYRDPGDVVLGNIITVFVAQLWSNFGILKSVKIILETIPKH